MAFEVKDDHCRRAVFRFYALLIVSNSVLPWRQFRLQLRFSVVGELILTSITDDPNFGITDFHSKLSWPSKQSHEKESQPHRYEPFTVVYARVPREEVAQQNSFWAARQCP